MTCAPAAPAPVLILSGDPRRGKNVFDVEVAKIRHANAGGLMRSEHVAMVGLAEIAREIDRLRPVVVHLIAHDHFGVVLARDEAEHIVDASDVAAAIGRADHQPLCIVLAFCRSSVIARQVGRTVAAVISWNGELTDEQGAHFADVFYRHLARRADLARAFAEGSASVRSQWQVAPEFLARWDGPLV